MKRYLRDNPVGPLPNTRMRYLSKEQNLIYLRAAIDDSERGGAERAISLQELRVRLRRRKSRSPRERQSRQVGVVDRANPRFDKNQDEEVF